MPDAEKEALNRLLFFFMRDDMTLMT